MKLRPSSRFKQYSLLLPQTTCLSIGTLLRLHCPQHERSPGAGPLCFASPPVGAALLDRHAQHADPPGSPIQKSSKPASKSIEGQCAWRPHVSETDEKSEARCYNDNLRALECPLLSCSSLRTGTPWCEPCEKRGPARQLDAKMPVTHGPQLQSLRIAGTKPPTHIVLHISIDVRWLLGSCAEGDAVGLQCQTGSFRRSSPSLCLCGRTSSD